MFLTKTYAIQDCQYWNDGSSVGTLQIDSGVTCTSNGSYITITKSTSGEKYVKLPVNLPSSFEFSFSNISEAKCGAKGLSNLASIMRSFSVAPAL